MSRILGANGKSESICKPKNQIDFRPDAAVKVDVNRGKIAEERKKRLEEAKNKPDAEYIELFETVKQLIVNGEFWELPPDSSIIKAWGFIMYEVHKRGITLPELPKDMDSMKTQSPNKLILPEKEK